MLKSIRRTAVFLTIAVLLAVVPFDSAVYAATDTYQNFSELSAHEVQNVDYKIESNDTGSAAVILAIHGGRIEKGTTELAKAVSDLGSYSYYSFIGIKSSDNASLHITSSNFDEQTARLLVSKSKWAVSIHGAAGTTKITYLGGLDTALGKQIAKNLTAAGFVVKPAPSGLTGTDRENIANGTMTGKGVQLELTRSLRDSFFTSTGGPSPTLTKYAAAVSKAVKTYAATQK